MLASKQRALKPIFESNDGVHLTIYLVNRGSLIDLKSQLRARIAEASEWLEDVFEGVDQKRFLEPVQSLLSEPKILNQMKGNVGLFRTMNTFRMLNIPVNVEPLCQVATSYHVKPLLRWIQTDLEFLLLGVNEHSAQLYFGSRSSFKLIDAVFLPKKLSKNISSSELNRLHNELADFLNDWIDLNTSQSKPKLFVAGDLSKVIGAHRTLAYAQTATESVSKVFGDGMEKEICAKIRDLLRRESQHAIEKALREFRFAEAGNRAQKNIFQISKAVVEGRVRKLIVTDEVSIFGKIDAKQGKLVIHPCDMDHEDDDVLDDLAQMVLNQGGEVVIAKRSEIPNSRPILAILDDDEPHDQRKVVGLRVREPREARSIA